MPQPDKAATISDRWSSLPTATRRSIMQATIQQARDIAATAVMLQSQGGPHDIMKAATDAKLAAAPSPAPMAEVGTTPQAAPTL